MFRIFLFVLSFLFLMSPTAFCKNRNPTLSPETLQKVSYAVADPNQIASTPTGLMLLHYIATCALNPGQELTAQVGEKNIILPEAWAWRRSG